MRPSATTSSPPHHNSLTDAPRPRAGDGTPRAWDIRPILCPERLVAARRLSLSLTCLICGLLRFSTPARASAQDPCFLDDPPPPSNCFMVSVTPNSATTRARPANSGGFSETFTVENTGLEGDTYTITCASSGNVTCTGTSTSSVTLFYGGSTSVSASYSVGAVGSGGLTLTARGTTGASSTGGYTVPISADGNTPPTVSLTPHNASYRDVSKCVAACFDLIASHATPVYTSLGAARSFSLVYNSSTHKPTPVVQLDVSNQGDGGIYPYPTTRTVQVRLASSGALLTLLNGTQTVYYAAGTTQTARLVAALDAQANGLSTGAYAVNVTVTSNYATGSVQSTTVSTRLLVDDESRSGCGVGVTAAGVQRWYLFPGTRSVVICEVD